MNKYISLIAVVPLLLAGCIDDDLATINAAARESSAPQTQVQPQLQNIISKPVATVLVQCPGYEEKAIFATEVYQNDGRIWITYVSGDRVSPSPACTVIIRQ